MSVACEDMEPELVAEVYTSQTIIQNKKSIAVGILLLDLHELLHFVFRVDRIWTYCLGMNEYSLSNAVGEITIP